MFPCLHSQVFTYASSLCASKLNITNRPSLFPIPMPTHIHMSLGCLSIYTPLTPSWRQGTLDPLARFIIFDKFNPDEALKQDVSFWEDLCAGVQGLNPHVARKYTSMGVLGSKVTLFLSNFTIDQIESWFPSVQENVGEAFKRRFVGGNLRDDQTLYKLNETMSVRYLKRKPKYAPNIQDWGLRFIDWSTKRWSKRRTTSAITVSELFEVTFFKCSSVEKRTHSKLDRQIQRYTLTFVKCQWPLEKIEKQKKLHEHFYNFDTPKDMNTWTLEH